MIARTWPVDAVVGENGALYFAHDAKNQAMTRVFTHSQKQRLENRAKLDAIREAVLTAIPGAGIASDQPYRETDLAIDFCEDVDALPQQQINQIVTIFEDFGATAKISSIHVNGWFGDYDKLSMTKRIMADLPLWHAYLGGHLPWSANFSALQQVALGGHTIHLVACSRS